jgi:hypothetical protein
MQMRMIRQMKRSAVIRVKKAGDDAKWKNLPLMGMAGNL